MDGDDQRRALEGLVAGAGVSLSALSRMLRRNPAWLQQYLRRGTPRLLPEEDRGRLARFFGVDEVALGGPSSRMIGVVRIDVAASAGPGRLVGGTERSEAVAYPATELERIGVSPGNASIIAVAGQSMEPTLNDGDRILVDRGQRIPRGSTGLWVVRCVDELLVKRLARADGGWRLISDNGDYEDRIEPLEAIEVIGRVVQLTREF